MKYQSGEEIKKGDNVLFHGEAGEVDFVAEGLVGDPAMDWNVKHNGPGVMILEPKFFGRVYIRESEISKELIFVSRNSKESQP
jgi:hypothetical protein